MGGGVEKIDRPPPHLPARVVSATQSVKTSQHPCARCRSPIRSCSQKSWSSRNFTREIANPATSKILFARRSPKQQVMAERAAADGLPAWREGTKTMKDLALRLRLSPQSWREKAKVKRRL